ncbi:MAG TPA: methyltransferase, partial [Myxococcales bacterium]
MARSAEELSQRQDELSREFGEEITLDALTRELVIYQRRRGHRHSTDDLLTAWYAVVHAPPSPSRLLDLGSGIGGVGLAVLSRFPQATLTAVEVQRVSFALLTENVRANQLETRVDLQHGDLRELAAEIPFDLITASPPYFAVKDGLVSADSQRAAARFELHGGVDDYCATAARALAPEGRFIFCFPTPQSARAVAACEQAGLQVLAMRDVVPRATLPPLFSLFACARHAERPTVEEPALPATGGARRRGALVEEPALPATGGARRRGALVEEPALPATGGARRRGALVEPRG